jgi:hypothetical protein
VVGSILHFLCLIRLRVADYPFFEALFLRFRIIPPSSTLFNWFWSSCLHSSRVRVARFYECTRKVVNAEGKVALRHIHLLLVRSVEEEYRKVKDPKGRIVRRPIADIQVDLLRKPLAIINDRGIKQYTLFASSATTSFTCVSLATLLISFVVPKSSSEKLKSPFEIQSPRCTEAGG